jgi:hypothetical protein
MTYTVMCFSYLVPYEQLLLWHALCLHAVHSPFTINPLYTVSSAAVTPVTVTQITVIPQDAHLFSGTIRQSIDPTATVSDARLWEVIQQVQFPALQLWSNLFYCCLCAQLFKQVLCVHAAMVCVETLYCNQLNMCDYCKQLRRHAGTAPYAHLTISTTAL